MREAGQHIEQTLSEQLQQRLTPLQVRFVRMLEMNTDEEGAAIERELADNPALTMAEEEVTPSITEDGERFEESSEQLQLNDYASPDDIPYYRTALPSSGRDDEYVPLQADESEDLYSSLLSQLGELPLDAYTRSVAEYIVGNLDPNGYLQRTPAAMAADIEVSTGREVPAAEMQRALSAVRSLDPAGVGAMNLEQSLELQLLRLPESESREDALAVIHSAWDLFLRLQTTRIASRLHIPAERAKTAVALLTRLNPKPGGGVGSMQTAAAATVMPDFVVEVSPEGELTVALAGRHPDLVIEASFESAVKLMSTRRTQVKGGDYIRTRFNDARDFISLLKQRRDTLLAVITAIAARQREYFLTADDATLRPMTLRDIAEATSLDKSTISRATSGKYVQTRSGIVPVRHLFSEGYEGDSGAFSARTVEAALRRLVQQEDAARPLSDEALCHALSEQGFDVSRRTVAKYRDRIGIPVARLRKRK